MIGAYLESWIDVEVWVRTFPSWGRDLYTQMPTPDQAEKIPLSMLVRKSAYGLKQSAENFLAMLDAWLAKYGFTMSMGDRCLHIFYVEPRGSTAAKWIFLCIHIDDCQGVSSDNDTWNHFLSAFMTRFPCKDIGELDFHLGVSMAHDIVKGQMQLSQKPLIEKAARVLGINPDSCYKKHVPMAQNLILQDAPADEVLTSDQAARVANCQYREVVGAILYIYIMSRPNIGNCVHQLCRFGSKYSIQHVDALHWLMLYLLATRDDGICYHADSSIIPHMAADSSWSGCPVTCTSTFGFGIYMCGSLVAWGVGRSAFPLPTSMDSEAYSLREAFCVFIGLLKAALSILPQLSSCAPYLTLQDNTSVIDLANGLGKASKRRHIRMRVLYVIHLLAIKLFRLGWVPTDEMWADIFTKSTGKALFRKHSRTMLGDQRQIVNKNTDELGNEQPPTATIEPDNKERKAGEHDLDVHMTDDTKDSAED